MDGEKKNHEAAQEGGGGEGGGGDGGGGEGGALQTSQFWHLFFSQSSSVLHVFLQNFMHF